MSEEIKELIAKKVAEATGAKKATIIIERSLPRGINYFAWQVRAGHRILEVRIYQNGNLTIHE
jgi:hypothetical protein